MSDTKNRDIKEGDLVRSIVFSISLTNDKQKFKTVDDPEIFLFLGFQIENEKNSSKDPQYDSSVIWSKLLYNDEIKFWKTFTYWNRKLEIISKEIYKQLQTNLKNFFEIV